MHEQGAEGADGNARLTGTVGLVLLVILFVEGITVLQVRQLITLHIFLGLLLIPPTALKIASTGYRFVRYYTHSPSYVRHGPPPLLLRLTGPLLIIFTGAILVTGVALLVVGPDHRGLLLTAHQVSFIIWFALMTLHVLGHAKEAAILSRWDWWPRADRARPRGKGQRHGLMVISVVAGVALGLALLPVASPWTTRANLGKHSRHEGAAHVGPTSGRALPQVSFGNPGDRPAVNVKESLWP